jgi:biofilm PGA synthesis N-glycosyltransferase PgaC
VSTADRLLVITPVRNEAAHIERMVRSVQAQTRAPDTWLVVDDGSDDGTLDILRALEREIDYLTVLQAPRAQDTAVVPKRDRLAGAAELIAFNHGLHSVPSESFTHIGKLDGDLELPTNYLAVVLAEFAGDSQLGIAGGIIVEPCGDAWQEYRVPDYHVRGALKTYSAECFRAIGGLQPRLGWDTIDETYARMHGFGTRALRQIVVRHHRPWGTAEGRLRGRARHGQAAYILRYGPAWSALRSVKVATASPVGLSGVAFFFGYVRAAVLRTPRVEDAAYARFVRRELWGRVLRPRRFYAA